MNEMNEACGTTKYIIAFVVGLVFGCIAFYFKTRYDSQSANDNSKVNFNLMLSFGGIAGLCWIYLIIGGFIMEFSKECRAARYKYKKGDI